MRKYIALLLAATMLLLLAACVPGSDINVQPTQSVAPTAAEVTPGSTLPTVTTAVTPTTTAAVTITAVITDTPLITGTPTVTATGGLTATGELTATDAVSGASAITGTGAATSTPVAAGAATATATQNITGTSIAVSTSAVTETLTFTDAAGISELITIPPLPSDMSDMTIAQIISTTEEFSTLASALQTAGLLDLLDAPGPLTLFAPIDSAFALYPAETLEQLLADPALLLDLLQYHLVVDSAPAAALAELGAAVTYLGDQVDITINRDGGFSANDVVIVRTDIQASNGIIHIINGLLVPPSAQDVLSSRTVNPQAATNTGAGALTLEALAAQDTSGQTILQILGSIDDFATLAAAVDSSGLNDALSIGGPITLLAPTNAAFAELSDVNVESLLNSQPDELVRILQYHTVLDGVSAAQLAQLGTVLTATGDPVTVTVNSDGVIVLNGGAATVFVTDIEASNGIIHAISAVLLPPPAE